MTWLRRRALRSVRAAYHALERIRRERYHEMRTQSLRNVKYRDAFRRLDTILDILERDLDPWELEGPLEGMLLCDIPATDSRGRSFARLYRHAVLDARDYFVSEVA